VSNGDVGGQCLRDPWLALPPPSSVRASRWLAPSVSTVSVEGRCPRALHEHMVYLSALFCCTLTAMDACYSQLSTSARPSFRRSRCPPKRKSVGATGGRCLRVLSGRPPNHKKCRGDSVSRPKTATKGTCFVANSCPTKRCPLLSDASDARHRDGGKGPGGGVDLATSAILKGVRSSAVTTGGDQPLLSFRSGEGGIPPLI